MTTHSTVFSDLQREATPERSFLMNIFETLPGGHVLFTLPEDIVET